MSDTSTGGRGGRSLTDDEIDRLVELRAEERHHKRQGGWASKPRGGEVYPAPEATSARMAHSEVVARDQSGNTWHFTIDEDGTVRASHLLIGEDLEEDE